MRIDSITRIIHENTATLVADMLPKARKMAKGQPTYVCPKCGHGKGGDGLCVNPKNPAQLKCFGCGWTGDVIALYQDVNNVGFVDACGDLARLLGCGLPEETPKRPFNRAVTRPDVACGTVAQPTGDKAQDEDSADWTPYYADCVKGLEESPEAQRYLARRGISLDDARGFGLGFDAQADPAGSGHFCPRVIIPVTRNYYVARSTDPNTEKAFRVMGPVGASPEPFGVEYLRQAGFVYVVEGPFDAMSVRLAGGRAVSVNSVANIGLVTDTIKEQQAAGLDTPDMVIIALDNDTAGRNAAQRLAEQLKETGQPYYVTDKLAGPYKDANEMWKADRKGLTDNVAGLITISARPDGISSYMLDSLNGDLEEIGAPRKTGIQGIDSLLGGGMRTGLHILGAVSSLGKTTLALQLAEGLATQGSEVVYVSLEQSRLELCAKLLARHAYESDSATEVTAAAIMDGTADARELNASAKLLADATGNRLSIISAPFGWGVKDVEAYLCRYEKLTGVAPVVVIDYLQALRPSEDRQDYRQAVDASVRALKILSKEHNTPILALSSLNRGAYSKAVDFSSFKESGGIEFTADYLLGLNLSLLADFREVDADAIKKAKAEYPREVTLELLKGRCLPTGDRVKFEYYTAHDCFREAHDKALQTI